MKIVTDFRSYPAAGFAVSFWELFMFLEFYLNEMNPANAAVSAQFIRYKFGDPPYPKSILHAIVTDVDCLSMAHRDMVADSRDVVSAPDDVPWWPTGLIGEFFARSSDLIVAGKPRPNVLVSIFDSIPKITPFWRGFNELRFVAFFAAWVRCDCPIADLTRGSETVTISTVLSSMCRRYIADKLSDQLFDLFCDLSAPRQLADPPDHGGQQADTADHAARQDDTADHAARQDDKERNCR